MLPDFGDEACDALLAYFQMLALVFRLTDGKKSM